MIKTLKKVDFELGTSYGKLMQIITKYLSYHITYFHFVNQNIIPQNSSFCKSSLSLPHPRCNSRRFL